MIRTAVKEDLKEILDLYKFLSSDEDYTLDENYAKVWDNILGQSDVVQYFVYEKDNQIVCSACISVVPNLTRNGRPYAVIENVVTHPDHRRKGYGKEIIQRCINYAKNRNCHKVMLLSGIVRKDAHEFYRNVGFDSESKQAFQIRLDS
jgi:N-acetylglutamate synthase-like GNAT family acetyltransferase